MARIRSPKQQPAVQCVIEMAGEGDYIVRQVVVTGLEWRRQGGMVNGNCNFKYEGGKLRMAGETADGRYRNVSGRHLGELRSAGGGRARVASTDDVPKMYRQGRQRVGGREGRMV